LSAFYRAGFFNASVRRQAGLHFLFRGCYTKVEWQVLIFGALFVESEGAGKAVQSTIGERSNPRVIPGCGGAGAI
jgi:hypothetical protein